MKKDYSLEEIEWRDIPDFDKYECSEYGDVRNKRTGHIFKQSLSEHNPRRVNLTRGGVQYVLMTHRIVAACFHPDYNQEKEFEFIDGDPNNCHWQNIRITNRWKWTLGLF